MKRSEKPARLIFQMVCLLGVAVFSFGCGKTASENENKPAAKPIPDIAKQKEEIKQTLVDMWEAIEKGDTDRYASYIHPDFTQWGETAKTLRVGKQAEVKGIKDWIEEPTKVATRMKEPKVTVRGDTAWITYFWEDEGTTKGKPFATRGKSTRIFVKENGKWLCIHGHYTLLEDEKE
jgi:ketosteroid isomerase-like protein